MAVNYKEIKERFDKLPFNSYELAEITRIEEEIDKVVTTIFLDKEINIIVHLAPNTTIRNAIRRDRMPLIIEEIKGRYQEAGWKVETSPHQSPPHTVFTLNGRVE